MTISNKKERQRYILFKIIRDSNFSIEINDLVGAIWASIWRYFGMKEANKMGLWLYELNVNSGYGIIRCSHSTKEFLITSLTLIKEINGRRIIISPIKTSGTIKKIKEIKTNILKV